MNRPGALKNSRTGAPPAAPSFLTSALKTMRLWQWAKNILMFVPLVLAHQIGDLEKVSATLLGFVLFGLCASATYIWNDLYDLSHDRLHPSKKNRPLASGALTVRSAKVLSAGLLSIGIVGAFVLSNFMFVALVLGYIAITTLYSLYLKQALIFDVLVLSGLYTYRIFLGASLTGISLSPWLLAFSMFFSSAWLS
jgi:4-hydroxybenzoate polyprenyltransferase